MLDTAYLMLGSVFAYLIVLVVIAEGLGELPQTGPEITRKIVHIGAGNVMLLAWWFAIPRWMILVASAIAGIVALVSYFLPILPSINSVGRQSLGTFFYAVSIGVVSTLFVPPHFAFAVVGILVMAWGDGLAAVFGQRWGRHPYQVLGNRKSWEGSATMTIASTAVTGLTLGGAFGFSLEVSLIAVAVGAIATLLEAISQWGIDNLTVPLGSAGASFVLAQWLLG
ncbi:MAG: phosphatidate cytidylyltransferase [Spirulina sp. SIO3F2]|nr:phosphatidate cytidylyltransferase [Spirulina sp. SIO3F2]